MPLAYSGTHYVTSFLTNNRLLVVFLSSFLSKWYHASKYYYYYYVCTFAYLSVILDFLLEVSVILPEFLPKCGEASCITFAHCFSPFPIFPALKQTNKNAMLVTCSHKDTDRQSDCTIWPTWKTSEGHHLSTRQNSSVGEISKHCQFLIDMCS